MRNDYDSILKRCLIYRDGARAMSIRKIGAWAVKLIDGRFAIACPADASRLEAFGCEIAR